MSLENYSIPENKESENLAKEIDDVLESINKEESQAAAEFIKSLDKNNLSNFIEKQLKEGDSWLTYWEMKNKSFYAFMVQSSIDLISDKLKDNNNNERKFDENWDMDDENWKTLDGWLKQKWWIDNKYWWWTRALVKMVQKILWIHDDWFAGPQYFANVTAFIKGDKINSFDVKNVEEYKYSNISDKVIGEEKKEWDELEIQEKKITSLNELPKNIDDYKFNKYIYRVWTTVYEFYKDWYVLKTYKNEETSDYKTIKLTYEQIKNDFGDDVDLSFIKQKKYLEKAKEWLLNSKKKIGPYNIIERELLDDSDFGTLFNWEPSQWNLWNCYFISALWVLKDFWDFSTLIKGSISKSKGSFEKNGKTVSTDFYTVKMPLWEPWGVDIHVSQSEINLAKLKGPDWFKLLEVAYTKYVVNHFNNWWSKFRGIVIPDMMNVWYKNNDKKTKVNDAFNVIKWWHPGFALQTLLWSNNLEGWTFMMSNGQKIKERNNYLKRLKKMKKGKNRNTLNDEYLEKAKSDYSLNVLDQGKKDLIKKMLVNFSFQRWESILLSTLPWLWWDKASYPVDTDTRLAHNHAYSISSIEKDYNGEITNIHIQNPWNRTNNSQTEYTDEITLTFDQLLTNFSTISISKTTDQFLDGKTNKEDITITDINRNIDEV